MATQVFAQYRNPNEEEAGIGTATQQLPKPVMAPRPQLKAPNQEEYDTVANPAPTTEPEPIAPAAQQGQSAGQPQAMAESAGDPGEWSSTPQPVAPQPPRILVGDELKAQMLNAGGAFNSGGMKGLQQYLQDNPDLKASLTDEMISKIASNPNKKNDTPEGIGVNAVVTTTDMSNKLAKVVEQTRGKPQSMSEAIGRVFEGFKLKPGSPEEAASNAYLTGLINGQGYTGSAALSAQAYKDRADEIRQARLKQMEIKGETDKALAVKQFELDAKNAERDRIAGASAKSVADQMAKDGLPTPFIAEMSLEVKNIQITAKDNPAAAQGAANALFANLTASGASTATLRKVGDALLPTMEKGMNDVQRNQLNDMKNAGVPDALIYRKVFGKPEEGDAEKINKLVKDYKDRLATEGKERERGAEIAADTTPREELSGKSYADWKTDKEVQKSLDIKRGEHELIRQDKVRYTTERIPALGNKTLAQVDNEQKVELERLKENHPELAGQKVVISAYQQWQRGLADATAKAAETGTQVQWPPFKVMYAKEFNALKTLNPELASVLDTGKTLPKAAPAAGAATSPAATVAPVAPAAPTTGAAGTTTSPTAAGGPAPTLAQAPSGAAVAPTAQQVPVAPAAPVVPATGGARPIPQAPTQVVAKQPEAKQGTSWFQPRPSNTISSYEGKQILDDNTNYAKELSPAARNAPKSIAVINELQGIVRQNPGLWGQVSSNPAYAALVAAQTDEKRQEALEKLFTTVNVPENQKVAFNRAMLNYAQLGLGAVQSVGAQLANSNVEGNRIIGTLSTLKDRPEAAEAQLEWLKGVAEYDKALASEFSNLRRYGPQLSRGDFERDFNGPDGPGTRILLETEKRIDRIMKRGEGASGPKPAANQSGATTTKAGTSYRILN